MGKYEADEQEVDTGRSKTGNLALDRKAQLLYGIIWKRMVAVSALTSRRSSDG
jgi:hypothetical protein